MQTADVVLTVLRERGQKGQPVERLYRQLYNPELYLRAYANLYGNKGAMTPGTTDETVDGMSLAKIDRIIDELRHERFRWKPVRRVYITKKNSTKLRPLGLPTWTDKLVQEVIRMLLSTYYERQFSPHSHGFRPNRGCHTALKEIQNRFQGCSWFIEGDIKGCFDNIDHQVLLSILAEKIHDNRFLRLLRGLLRAGYMENWHYGRTLSGTPQGGIVSPLLSNIYLDRLDQFVNEQLSPRFNKGKKRKRNNEYNKFNLRSARARRRGDKAAARKWMKVARSLPSLDMHDPEYRRLSYVRYADDFLLGFAGPKSEAKEIKKLLGKFLKEQLHLEMSAEKTLITHARTEKARFLGYDLLVIQNDSYLSNLGNSPAKKRSASSRIRFEVPYEVVSEKCKPFMTNGKPCHRLEMTHNSVYTIIADYQTIYRGIANYYQMAHDLNKKVGRLKWVMERSLTATLANKLKTSRKKIYRRYRTKIKTERGEYWGLQTVVAREGKKPLVATWGGISLARNDNIVLNDQPPLIWNQRTELLERLLADECELCGSHSKVQVHHIKGLKSLSKLKGANKPEWVKKMAARQRKTLVVCHTCHSMIHAGRMS